MNRHHLLLAVLWAAFASCLAATTARADDKDKPKGSATFDDRTATVTETLDGKEKTTKLELKYSLKVKGHFDKDGFKIEELDMDGPAGKLNDADGNTVGLMEKGDIIVEVDGKAVKSAKEYVKAINEAADHNKIKLKVRDVNTGNDQEFFVAADKR